MSKCPALTPYIDESNNCVASCGDLFVEANVDVAGKVLQNFCVRYCQSLTYYKSTAGVKQCLPSTKCTESYPYEHAEGALVRCAASCEGFEFPLQNYVKSCVPKCPADKFYSALNIHSKPVCMPECPTSETRQLVGKSSISCHAKCPEGSYRESSKSEMCIKECPYKYIEVDKEKVCTTRPSCD